MSSSSAFAMLHAKIKNAVEYRGLEADQVMKEIHNETERQLLDERDKLAGYVEDEEKPIPSEIQLMAQALAYREATIDDLDDIHKLLNKAYQPEIKGEEAFRSDTEAILKESIQYYLEDTHSSYQWLLAEVPSGKGIEEDGSLLGVCCFSTDGISRRNGLIEGEIASIRYFAILPRYHGLCLGRRLLGKVESLMKTKYDCLRAMICIPSARRKMMSWVSRRDYLLVNASFDYPFDSLHQQPLTAATSSSIKLLQYIKALVDILPGGEEEKVKEKEEEAIDVKASQHKQEEMIAIEEAMALTEVD